MATLRVIVVNIPENKFCEKCVALTCPKVVQQSLRVFGGVFEEAEDSDKHFDNFQRGQLTALGHVGHTQGDAALVWKKKDVRNDMDLEISHSLYSLCRYVMTDGLRLCLEMVRRMSAEVFLHIRLCSGHVEVTAEKSSVRSSFLANSSTAGM